MIWGWATWRSRWQYYDAHISNWPAIRNSGLLESIFVDPLQMSYWHTIWNRTFAKEAKVTWWDYQWVFTCISNGGLTVIPSRNLVSNVGFGPDATHTTANSIVREAMGLQKLSLTGPEFVLSDTNADRYIFDHHFGGRWGRLPLSLLRRPKALARKLARALRSLPA